MPVPSGMAFVLIQHLDPTHESLMVELLAKYTAMKVVEVRENMEIEADTVYVIPPDRHLTVRAGALHLTASLDRRPNRAVSGFSIDHFFGSLAEDQGEKAIGIILTGTGTDGTLGLRAIKGAGGMVMVQDPATCAHDGMPRSAAGTGLVDFILPVERMPETLIGYVRHPYIRSAPATEETAAQDPDPLAGVLALLRTRIKHDFRGYKKVTVLRRIHRRMGLHHIERLPEYLEFLRKSPDEVTRLFKDLLISVTNFFRDPNAFEELSRKAIAALVQEKGADAPIRVWAPGCATGEEPYSIGMLFLEHLSTAKKHCPLQIFATDIDEGALETARAGLYPESISTNVSPDRLRRFFNHQEKNHTYQISKQLRESVVFAAQNLISDPPFSKLDLITCRNLLIYLDNETQNKILRMFHYALNPGGYLFLGSSETVGFEADLFRMISKKMRIYLRQDATYKTRVDFPVLPVQRSPGRPFPAAPQTNQEFRPKDVAEQLLLEHLAPASLLVSLKGDILYTHGAVGKYLDFPTGEPALNLLHMSREGLRSELRSAMQKAIREDTTVMLEGAQVKRDGKQVPTLATLRPVRKPAAPEGLLLITFEDQPGAVPTPAPVSGKVHKAGSPETHVRRLENELKETQEELQNTMEQTQSSGEELRAANEEVMSMNEELQSSNEELETSKEEMQSLNEELSTVNLELQSKVEELTDTSADLANLLTSTELATLFLDRECRIRRFTPASTKLVNITASDIGRPVSDFTHHLAGVDLRRDADQVLREPDSAPQGG